jgi:protein-tyrosine phosphatase
MGNICRSPAAEGVVRFLAERDGLMHLFEFDSAGTHGYHIGEAPDARMCQAAGMRGYDLSMLRARQINTYDFVRFDYILAMDCENLNLLRQACPDAHLSKLGLALDYANKFQEYEVPDPYYGGPEGFEQVLDLIEDAMAGLLRQLSQK